MSRSRGLLNQVQSQAPAAMTLQYFETAAVVQVQK